MMFVPFPFVCIRSPSSRVSRRLWGVTTTRWDRITDLLLYLTVFARAHRQVCTRVPPSTPPDPYHNIPPPLPSLLACRSWNKVKHAAKKNVLLAVPSLLYAINNYLKFVMQLYFRPATVKMLSNLKVGLVAWTGYMDRCHQLDPCTAVDSSWPVA